jgi:hypothetical protein
MIEMFESTVAKWCLYHEGCIHSEIGLPSVKGVRGVLDGLCFCIFWCFLFGISFHFCLSPSLFLAFFASVDSVG